MCDIAIIATSFELQDTDNFEKLWRNIEQGKVITKYQLVEKNFDKFKLKDYNLEQIKKFSPRKFKYTSEQSKKIDPQHRRLLTLTDRMLNSKEGNRKLLSTLGEKVGVYTAVGSSYYLLNNLLSSGINLDYTTYINNVSDTAASKISYYFDFHGPSLNFSSACSSSSLALNYAIKDLNTGQITAAIVGTSRLPVEQSLIYQYKQDSIFSKSGLCSPFDKSSDGMVPGFGTIVFTIKRKEDAIKDNNNILAIIKGIGISNDGNNKASYTAPGIIGQCEAITNAYKNIDITTDDIDYLETHGTGTTIGDAIEMETISKMFAMGKKTLEVGSIKANYGHLDNSSSFLSLLKAIAMLNYQKIPVQANYNSRNPLLTKSNVSISKKVQDTHLTNIAINSFGMGGTNAHIVIQKYESNPLELDLEITNTNEVEEILWIAPKSMKDSSSSTSKTTITKEDLVSHISNYLGYSERDIINKTIGDLDLESYVLIDLLDELHTEFGIQIEISDFQDLNGNMIDTILSKVSGHIDEQGQLLHILGEFDANKKTLFLIHPAGGTVNGYYHFFKNNSLQYNVVLVSFPFSEINTIKTFNLEQLSRLYKEKILSFINLNKINKTSFIIGGYSFGGNVAFEIARQLQMEGFETVPDIVMIDSHPIEAYNHVGKKEITDKVLNMALDEFIEQGIIEANISKANIEKYSEVWKINHNMLKLYKTPVEKLNSKLNILICKEDENKDLLNELGIKYLDKTIWQKRFNTEIYYDYVDGNHYSIYSDEKLGRHIGEKITQIMESNR